MARGKGGRGRGGSPKGGASAGPPLRGGRNSSLSQEELVIFREFIRSRNEAAEAESEREQEKKVSRLVGRQLRSFGKRAGLTVDDSSSEEESSTETKLTVTKVEPKKGNKTEARRVARQRDRADARAYLALKSNPSAGDPPTPQQATVPAQAPDPMLS